MAGTEDKQKGVKAQKKVRTKKEPKSDATIKTTGTGDEEEEAGSDSDSVFTVSDQQLDDADREHSTQIGSNVAALATIHVDRDEYLQAHRDLTLERNHQQVLNNILHRRLAEYYKFEIQIREHSVTIPCLFDALANDQTLL